MVCELVPAIAKSIKGRRLRSRSKEDVTDFLHNLSLQGGIDEWQVKQAAKALECLYRDFLNIDLGIDPDKYLRDEGSSKTDTESFIFRDAAIWRFRSDQANYMIL